MAEETQEFEEKEMEEEELMRELEQEEEEEEEYLDQLLDERHHGGSMVHTCTCMCMVCGCKNFDWLIQCSVSYIKRCIVYSVGSGVGGGVMHTPFLNLSSRLALSLA